MKRLNQIAICMALVTSLSVIPRSVNAEVHSNIKPFPKAFIGEWVGIVADKKRATSKTIRRICEHSYFEDNAYVIEFDVDRHRVNSTLGYDDYFYEYPLSYTKYNPTHISGDQLSYVYELGSDELASIMIENFDYKIANRELTLVNNYGTYYFKRCE